LSIAACQQSKQTKLLVTEDLKYAAFTWRADTDSVEFCIVHYIDIDKNGQYVLMRYDTFMENQKCFAGVITDTLRELINTTLNDTIYQKIYDFKPSDSVLYCGYNYCIDYAKTKGHRNTIQFIPSRSPMHIRALAASLDTLIYSVAKNQIQPFNLNDYKEKLKRISMTEPLPKLKKPKAKIPKWKPY